MIIFKNHLLWTNADLTKSKLHQNHVDLDFLLSCKTSKLQALPPLPRGQRGCAAGHKGTAWCTQLMEVHLNNNRKNGCNRCCSPTIHATLAPQWCFGFWVSKLNWLQTYLMIVGHSWATCDRVTKVHLKAHCHCKSGNPSSSNPAAVEQIHTVLCSSWDHIFLASSNAFWCWKYQPNS